MRKIKYTSYRGRSKEFFENTVKKQIAKSRAKKGVVNRLASYALEREKFSLLDVGCGPGSVAQMFQQHKTLKDRIIYTGIDQSPDVIEYCKSSLPSDYHLETRDFLTEGLPEEYFDIILVSHILEHLPHYSALIPSLTAKNPKKLIIITFAVLPGLDKDITLWDEQNEIYHNSYGYEPFLGYLKEESGKPVEVVDYGEIIKRTRWTFRKRKPKWHSKKVEIAWYI